MKELVEQISQCKDDVVFVGSLVGKNPEDVNDIDIVITSTDGLETIGECECHESNSVFAKDAKRCKIKGNDLIDIWLKDELPEYEVIDGIKYQTIDSQKEYYQDVLDSTDKQFIIDYIQEWQRKLQ